TPEKGMDVLVISPPSSLKKGSLYFDQVLYNVTINPRSPMRDEQVPFVNVNSDEAANAHWTALYQFSRNPHYIELPEEVSAVQKKRFQTILKRCASVILPENTSRKADARAVEKEFKSWDIRRDGEKITGKPVYSVNDVELVSGEAGKSLKEEFKQTSIKS